MNAALHLLRLLRGTSTLGFFILTLLILLFHLSVTVIGLLAHTLIGYLFCVLLGNSLLTWKAKKQPVVSLSSAEAEYRSCSKVIAKLTWVVHLLSDFSVTLYLPVPVYCDNRAAIHIAKNSVFHE